MKNKSIVQIYERVINGGNTALYLHFTINGKQYRKSTGLKYTGDKEADRLTKKAISMLQAETTANILSGKTGIYTESIKSRLSLLTYCEKWVDERKAKGTYYSSHGGLLHNLRGYIDSTKKDSPICKVDEKYCVIFYEYLLNKCKVDSTANLYFKIFKTILNKAVNEKLIECNFAKSVELKKTTEAERGYLIEEEITQFAKVENLSENEKEVQQAFLFSVFCGLRLSDIRRLTKANFEIVGDIVRLCINTKKTNKLLSIQLSAKARLIIDERINNKQDDEPIFNLKSTPTIERILAMLSTKAGIKKHVTFHVSRHTFATLLLTKGADIYTISSLLGHSDLSTTQIYAKIIDKKKDETLNLLNDVSL